jgi:acetyl-CoA C-acetyltransferase
VTTATPRVYVTGYARTPFGRFGGPLRRIPLPELGAIPARAALARAAVEAGEVDELALGVNFPGQERSVARQVLLRAGIPAERVAYTVDRACCSSLAAISMSARALALGETDVAVAGGAENLSRVPFFLTDMRWGNRLGAITLTDQLVVACPHTGVPRAVQASREAAEFGIGREEQDAWASRSQDRYADAAAAGAFDAELLTVRVSDERGRETVVERDEPPRPDTTREALAKLPTVNGSATVTAGNAPDLSTGATALVLVSERRLERDGGEPLASIEGWSLASGEPQKIASMPAQAARKALARAGLELSDIDLIEVNEAFAAVPLVTTRVLAGGDPALEDELRARTNVNGGSIAIGHPTGATGARLVMTLISELRRRGGGTGLVTICGGVGEAESMIVRTPAA